MSPEAAAREKIDALLVAAGWAVQGYEAFTHYIERMGTGTRDMIRRCRDAGLPEPVFTVTDGFTVALRRPAPPTGQATGQATPQVAPQLTPQVTPQATTQVATQDNQLEKRLLEELAMVLRLPTTQVTTQVAGQVGLLLRAANEPATRESLQGATGLRNREHFRQTYMEPLVAAGWLELTVPDKPTSRLQKYRLTEKGRAWLATLPAEKKK